jgi:hypothetical protein
MSILRLIPKPSPSFLLTEIEEMDNSGEWGFSIYAGQDVFFNSFIYPTKETAARARDAMLPVLEDLVFITTAEG